MFLRPRKFGKTLFTSTLEYYYDKNSENKFEKLFKDTYIGKNPTKLKNKYNLDFYINENQEAEEMLNSLFEAFSWQKNEEKIYVIIDEYDHFANELLGFNIANDITKKLAFNDMLGFTKSEVEYLMDEIELDEKTKETLLPIIKENYDGYIFSNLINSEFEKYKMYANTEELKIIPNLKCYTVVVIKDEIFVEEIVIDKKCNENN